MEINFTANLVVCLIDKTWYETSINFSAPDWYSIEALERVAGTTYELALPTLPISRIFVTEIETGEL